MTFFHTKRECIWIDRPQNLLQTVTNPPVKKSPRPYYRRLFDCTPYEELNASHSKSFHSIYFTHISNLTCYEYIYKLCGKPSVAAAIDATIHNNFNRSLGDRNNEAALMNCTGTVWSVFIQHSFQIVATKQWVPYDSLFSLLLQSYQL